MKNAVRNLTTTSTTNSISNGPCQNGAISLSRNPSKRCGDEYFYTRRSSVKDGFWRRLGRFFRRDVRVRVESLGPDGLSASALYTDGSIPPNEEYAPTQPIYGRPDSSEGTLVFQGCPFEIRVVGMQVAQFDKLIPAISGNELLMFSREKISSHSHNSAPYIHYDYERDASSESHLPDTYIIIPDTPSFRMAKLISNRTLEFLSGPDPVMSVDMSFQIANRLRVDNGAAVAGKYLRYGCYFFLSEPVSAKLYASVTTSEHVQLMIRKELDAIPKRRNCRKRIDPVGDHCYLPLTGVSYIVVRVSEPTGSCSGRHRYTQFKDAAKLEYIFKKARGGEDPDTIRRKLINLGRGIGVFDSDSESESECIECIDRDNNRNCRCNFQCSSQYSRKENESTKHSDFSYKRPTDGYLSKADNRDANEKFQNLKMSPNPHNQSTYIGKSDEVSYKNEEINIEKKERSQSDSEINGYYDHLYKGNSDNTSPIEINLTLPKYRHTKEDSEERKEFFEEDILTYSNCHPLETNMKSVIIEKETSKYYEELYDHFQSSNSSDCSKKDTASTYQSRNSEFLGKQKSNRSNASLSNVFYKSYSTGASKSSDILGSPTPKSLDSSTSTLRFRDELVSK
eukprot:IDg6444t1